MSRADQRPTDLSTGLSTESVDNSPEYAALASRIYTPMQNRKRKARRRWKCSVHLVFCHTITVLVYILLLVVLAGTIHALLFF